MTSLRVLPAVGKDNATSPSVLLAVRKRLGATGSSVLPAVEKDLRRKTTGPSVFLAVEQRIQTKGDRSQSVAGCREKDSHFYRLWASR